jgi:hypothetical protein
MELMAYLALMVFVFIQEFQQIISNRCIDE